MLFFFKLILYLLLFKYFFYVLNLLIFCLLNLLFYNDINLNIYELDENEENAVFNCLKILKNLTSYN